MPEIVAANGLIHAYPASGHLLSTDVWDLTVHSYVIKGAYSHDAENAEVPVVDRLFALNANTPYAPWATGDFVTTFGGNDELHDGNRKDTLEGGTGDDRYVLQNDGAADIIITGEGDDIVRGGGAEDRLVLRIDILDKMYEDWRAQLDLLGTTYGVNFVLPDEALKKPSERLGDAGATSGLPILGGFWDMACDGGGCVPLSTGSFYPTVAHPAQSGPGSFSATYSQLVYSYSHFDGDGVGHQVQDLPFGYTFELKNGDLIITFAYGPPPEGAVGAEHTQHTVTIEDFQDGDFGIHIYAPATLVGEDQPVWGFDPHTEELVVIDYIPGGAYTEVTDAGGVGYINNNGDFLPILAAIDPASTGSIPQTPLLPSPVIDGDDDDNLIDGGTTGEVIRSRGGNDTVNANGGDDRVDAGDGDDIVHLGAGADLLLGGFGLDVLFGESGDDGISGGDGDDQISGGTGADWLFGDGGNDTVFGDGGSDTISGGEGDDTLFGGAGADTLSGGDGNDTLQGGDGFDLLNGGEGADTLWGGAGRDVLNGDSGNDELHGDGGVDTLAGNDGDDFIFGGDGHDLLSGGTGADTIWGGAGFDRVEGDSGNDTLFGEGGDDIILGGDGNDLLSGSGGLDRLDGGSGNDILTGGAAVDRFVFATGYGQDRITDFAGNDFIVIDHNLALNFTEAMSHASQVGADVVFAFGDDMLTLSARSLGVLNAGDFEFA